MLRFGCCWSCGRGEAVGERMGGERARVRSGDASW
jgi:hypothetical protein